MFYNKEILYNVIAGDWHCYREDTGGRWLSLSASIGSPPLVDLVRSVSTTPSGPSAEDTLDCLDRRGVPHDVSDFFDDSLRRTKCEDSERSYRLRSTMPGRTWPEVALDTRRHTQGCTMERRKLRWGFMQMGQPCVGRRALDDRCAMVFPIHAKQWI